MGVRGNIGMVNENELGSDANEQSATGCCFTPSVVPSCGVEATSGSARAGVEGWGGIFGRSCGYFMVFHRTSQVGGVKETSAIRSQE